MLNTVSEIINDVLVKLNQKTTYTFYTDDILEDWLQEAHSWAAGHRKWPWTEGRYSTTFSSLVTDEDGNYRGEYPEDWKADSIREMYVGGYRLQKLNHEDFMIMREEMSDADDRVYTEHGRLYYINPQIDISGTIVMWGQFRPNDPDASVPTSTTVFSGNEEEGNEAIVEKILSYAYLREKEPEKSQFHHNRALIILEKIWEQVQEEQFTPQTHEARGGMWNRIDVLAGAQRDDTFKRDQFY